MLAREHPVAVNLPQGGKMLTPGFIAARVSYQVIRLQTELGRNEQRDFLWDHFARFQQASRKTQWTELECEAHPVPGMAPGLDVVDIVVVQDAVRQPQGLVGGKIEKGSTLARSQDFSAGHVTFAFPGGDCLIMFVIRDK